LEHGRNTAGACPGEILPLNGVSATSDEAKLEWFGTVRGRVGYLLNDGLLLYGTGGLALGQISASDNVNVSAAINGFQYNPLGQSKTNIGFAAGAGVEGRLGPWLSPN
jgi:outer membrane immunogenic protein